MGTGVDELCSHGRWQNCRRQFLFGARACSELGKISTRTCIKGKGIPRGYGLFSEPHERAVVAFVECRRIRRKGNVEEGRVCESGAS